MGVIGNVAARLDMFAAPPTLTLPRKGGGNAQPHSVRTSESAGLLDEYAGRAGV